MIRYISYFYCILTVAAVIGMPRDIFGATVNTLIDFEPTAGQFPDGSTPVDDSIIFNQFQSIGVVFGIDNDGDGVADPDLFPFLEMHGDETNSGGQDGFVLDDPTASFPLDRDVEAAGFEGQLGQFFLRTAPGGIGSPNRSNDLLITYTGQLAEEASGQIWDIDGTAALGSEQWRIEALNSNLTVIATVDSPIGNNLDLNGKPFVWQFMNLPQSIQAIRISFIGTKQIAPGLAFDNFNAFSRIIDEEGPATTTPEPGTLLLLGTGLVVLVSSSYRSRQRHRFANTLTN
ncbi:MAG: PEP-CTERM sorting domain-containing protein [Candidatus Binatia bacterium]